MFYLDDHLLSRVRFVFVLFWDSLCWSYKRYARKMLQKVLKNLENQLHVIIREDGGHIEHP